MVPTESLDQALAKIEVMGEVTHRDVSVVDATSRYVDLMIRIDNLRRMRERLTKLVNEATTVKDVLEVERELGRVTTELERMEGQMRLLSQQTTYATIRVTLEEEITPGPLGWVFYGGYHAIKWLFVWD